MIGSADSIYRKLTGTAFDTRRRQVLLIVAATTIFTALILFVYLRSHLVMNYSYRFYAPIFVMWLVLIGITLDFGIKSIAQSRKSHPVRFRCSIILLIGLLIVQSALSMSRLRIDSTWADNYKRMLEDFGPPAAKAIRKALPASEWLVVVADAGIVPYLSNAKTVDFGGLNDRFLANRWNLSKRQICDYFYSFDPGAVVITSNKWDSIAYGFNAEDIAGDVRWKKYALVKKYKTGAPQYHDYFHFLFLRKDLLPGNDLREVHERVP